MAPPAAAAPPEVAVSVLPVHSLVSGVMRGVGEARLLLPGGQSPHTSRLQPSQVRMLNAADLIVWVGPLLERPLEKPIAERRGAARIVTLMESDEIMLLQGHSDAHDESEEHGHSDAHHAHLTDPHVWLSFANARAIVRMVARELAGLDPANRVRYEANELALLARLERMRQSLHERLRGTADVRYVVFHDAYRYFEAEFGLQPVAVLTVNPQRLPGAGRVRAIRRLVESRKVRCVFSEPQFRPGLVDTLVADSGAATGVLDPLGAALTPGPEAWFALMEGIADALAKCGE